jgi:hypothetical protein
VTDVYTPPANSTLASSSAPISVVADNDVVSLSVSYGPFRSTETVWQQGAFCYPFLRSTRADARTFTIVRDDGWPSKPGVWVNDPPGPPVSGQALGLIYEVDFRAMANQAIGAAGSYTIDSLTWWAKGLTSGLPFGASMSSAVVNGSGLRLSIIGSNATMSQSGDMNMRNLVLPLANIPNASLNAPTFVRGKFSYAFDNSAYAFIGLVNTTSDAAGYLAAQRSAETFVGPPAVSNTSPVASLKAKYGTGAITDVSTRTGAAVYSSHFAGVQYVNGFTDVGDQVWDGAGAIPSLSTFKPQTPTPQYEVGALANPCIMFAVNSHVQDYYLTHLSVYQPKVGA